PASAAHPTGPAARPPATPPPRTPKPGTRARAPPPSAPHAAHHRASAAPNSHPAPHPKPGSRPGARHPPTARQPTPPTPDPPRRTRQRSHTPPPRHNHSSPTEDFTAAARDGRYQLRPAIKHPALRTFPLLVPQPEQQRMFAAPRGPRGPGTACGRDSRPRRVSVVAVADDGRAAPPAADELRRVRRPADRRR